MSPRFVVYGAGALGGVIGAELFDHGHDVVVIARGPHLAAIRSDGLTYVTPGGSKQLPVPVVGHPNELTFTDDDVVLLAMKSQHTAAALGSLADSAVAGIAVVCAQNGVANERLALRYFANVYGLCALSPTTHLSPGVVIANSASVRGVFPLGRYPGGDDAVADQIAAALTASNFDAKARPDVQRYKYTKLLTNLANAAQAVLEPSAVAAVGQLARAEGVAAYDAAGIDYVPLDEFGQLFGPLDLQPVPVEGFTNIGGSTWQSLARGASDTESDYLNGEIALLGRLHGVPTPVNSALQRMARAAARAHLAPGSLSEGAFQAELA